MSQLKVRTDKEAIEVRHIIGHYKRSRPPPGLTADSGGGQNRGAIDFLSRGQSRLPALIFNCLILHRIALNDSVAISQNLHLHCNPLHPGKQILQWVARTEKVGLIRLQERCLLPFADDYLFTGGKVKPLKAAKKANKDLDDDDKAFLEKKRAGVSCSLLQPYLDIAPQC